ncbi:uncharacterized protein [Drosophila tropicalis]|uniref:uncharacterized protein n=1 Tax=Drosophila tropicalis TaxID=46794 RepID=UPI0035AC138C
MEACGLTGYMQNPMLVQELIEKLPTQLKLQWATFPNDTKIPSMESFSKWIYDIAEAASQVTSPLHHKKSGSLNHHTEAPEEQVKEITCVVCNEPGHKIHSCPSFKATPHQQKISFLKNHKLCQQRLNRHHQKCQREKVCGIRGCRSKHHPLIHEMQPIPEAAKSSSPNRPAMVTNVHSPEGKHTQRSRESGSTYFRVIPIQIINKTKVTNTFAFLDEGSALTLIDNKVFKQLGLKGVPDPLCLKWTNDSTREENASERVTLTVANPHNGNQFYLEEVHSVDTLDLPLKEQITEQIENLVEKGYARMLTPEEIAAPNRRTWYLPTFITKNPNKPQKVRLVWDAAAQSGGKALNDYIWSGPDLLNSLFDLLLSFRVGRVAICGDIAEMFHQIRVKPAGTHAQRFLWFDSKSERQEPNYPQAAQAVKDYHYVDDFIYSGDDYVEVGNIATQVRDIHAAGGFHIRNWSSNSKEVLRILKIDSLLPEAGEITATEKVLGLYWVPNSDVFTFICKFARLKRNVLDSDKTPTKRELLQELMSISLEKRHWLGHWFARRIVTQMDTMETDPYNNRRIDHPEMLLRQHVHTFVDASELAYAAVCYLRIRQGKRTYLRFVASKAKVAPLSPLSIPRMELQAAVIGAKLNLTTKTHNANKHEWPKCDDLGPPNNAEVRHNILFIDNAPMELKLNAEYFSDWRRLYRDLARFILYIEKLKAKQTKASPPTEVSYEMIQQARTLLLRHAQSSEFNPEIRNLTRDENQLLRTRGRAENLNGQNQILLPYGHHITRLIVNWYHQEMHHTSHETCINRIRGMFYIPRLRVLYKGMRKSCQRCKNESAMPDPPQMAPLPIARLAAYQRPFTYVGIDYFGPFLVAVGRRSEKRWGVIFTCLTIRAVHIDLACSLDTTSCIMCIRNFINRRGTPREIYSDNGTNFKAAEKIICDKAQTINFNAVQPAFDDIKWKFNSPVRAYKVHYGKWNLS